MTDFAIEVRGLTKRFGERTAIRFEGGSTSYRELGAQVQRIADQVTEYFVPAVVVVAFLAFFGWWAVGNFPQALLAFIAVLIISCPCALGVATPAALMVGVGKGAEAGILIRGAEVLERARKITTVVFDKTGTLTRGTFTVQKAECVNGSESDLFPLVYAVEKYSTHPAAKAITDFIGEPARLLPPVEKQTEIPGYGLRAKVDGKVILLGNQKLMEKSRVLLNGATTSETGSIVYIAIDNIYR